MNADELRTKLTAALGMSLDTPDVVLLEQVSELHRLRQRIQDEGQREGRINELMQVCNCPRQTAIEILIAQGVL